jgi:hypothetical protein
MTTIIKSILAINPTAQVSVSADDINTLVWENGTTPIDNQIILNKQQELIAEYQANEYKRQRAKEYPDFKEYLDGIVKGDDAQIQKYINDCLAVKAKYPKE